VLDFLSTWKWENFSYSCLQTRWVFPYCKVQINKLYLLFIVREAREYADQVIMHMLQLIQIAID
jgi:hypothetical protein